MLYYLEVPGEVQPVIYIFSPDPLGFLLTGEKMKLTGLNSYGAATHCAAITAAQREVKPSGRSKNSSGKRSGAVLDTAALASTPWTSTSELHPASTVLPPLHPPSTSYHHRSRSMPDVNVGQREAHPAATYPGSGTSGDQAPATASSTFKLPCFAKTAQLAREKLSKLFSALSHTDTPSRRA